MNALSVAKEIFNELFDFAFPINYLWGKIVASLRYTQRDHTSLRFTSERDTILT